MTKAAKAPYEVGYHSTGGKRDGAVIIDSDGWNVANLWPSQRPIEEIDATARLLSTAPEGVDLAEAILQMLQRGYSFPEDLNIPKRALALLAKAEELAPEGAKHE